MTDEQESVFVYWGLMFRETSSNGIQFSRVHHVLIHGINIHVRWVSFLLVRHTTNNKGVFIVKETWIFYKLLANYYLGIDLVGRRWRSWSPGEWYLVRDFECQARWCEDPSRLTSNIDLIKYPLFERSCAIIGTQQTTSKGFSFKSIYDTLQMSR